MIQSKAASVVAWTLESDTLAGCDNMAEWTKRKYSKGEIDRAAAGLIPWWIDDDIKQPENLSQLWDIVENWRTSHGLPLNVFQFDGQHSGFRLQQTQRGSAFHRAVLPPVAGHHHAGINLVG